MANSAAAAKWTDDLSPWEQHRPVRAKITDDRAVTLPSKEVNSLLMCAVCLSVTEQTHAVMACLHRFCRACITRCLDNTKKECPTCRLHVASKRSTRPDDTLDSFIRTVYPDLRQYREEEEQATEDYNQRVHMKSNYQEHTKAWQESQRNAKGRSTKRPAENGGGNASPSADRSRLSSASVSSGGLKRSYSAPSRTNSSASLLRGGGGGGGGAKKLTSSLTEPSKKVDFLLRRHPEETKLPRLEKEKLRVPPKCRVFHIQKFLEGKLNCDKPGGLDVLIFKDDGSEVVLEKKDDLRYISNTLREPREQMNGGTGTAAAKEERRKAAMCEDLILYFRSRATAM